MKKMSALKSTLTAVGASLLFAACGGGGGSSTPPLTQAQHDALAQKFIAEATVEGLGYTMVKQDTQQTGYIVVKNSIGVLEAFYVDAWNPVNSAASFTPDYTYLAPAGGNTYTVYVPNTGTTTVWIDTSYYDSNGYYVSSGYWSTQYYDNSYYLNFSVAQPTSKDLQKIAAFKQTYDINASARKVQQKYGLSLSRATEVAKLAIQVKNTPKMSNDDYDSLAQQLLGVPASKLDSAIEKTAKGDSAASAEVDDIINRAAATNGVGPEQARALLESVTKSQSN